MSLLFAQLHTKWGLVQTHSQSAQSTGTRRQETEDGHGAHAPKPALKHEWLTFSRHSAVTKAVNDNGFLRPNFQGVSRMDLMRVQSSLELYGFIICCFNLFNLLMYVCVRVYFSFLFYLE